MRREVSPHIEPYYYHQVQCQLEVLDLEWCDFVKYRPPSTRADRQYALLRVRRDPRWRRTSLPVLDQFWRDVVAYRAATPDWRTNEHLQRCVQQRDAAAGAKRKATDDDPQQRRITTPRRTRGRVPVLDLDA